MTTLLEALACASLAGAPFAVLALAASRLFPRLSAPARATLAWLACARFLVALAPLPAIELPVLPATATPTATVTATPTATVTATPMATVTATPMATVTAKPPVAPPFPWLPIATGMVLALWLAGAAGSTARLLAERRRVARLVAGARPVPDDHPAAAAWRALGGARRRLPFLPEPRLALSRDVRAPLCTGAASPVVILPEVPLGSRGLRLALAHELGHLRRGDLWLAWIPALAGVVFWFHPLVRLAARELAQAREEACDAFALSHTGGEPAEYGPLLLAFGTGHPRLALAAAAGAPHVRQLERRLRMLLVHDRNGRRARWLTATILAALAPALAPVALGSVAAPADLEASGSARVLVAQATPSPRKTAPPRPTTPAPASAPAPEATPAPAAAPAPEATPAPARAPVAAVATLPAPAPVAPVPPVPPSYRSSRLAPPVPVPPAPPAGRVPPVPPAPPALLAARDGEFIVFRKDGRTSISTGDGVSAHELDAAVRGRKPPYVLIGRDGRTYLVDDPARLAELEAVFEGVGHDDEMASATLDQARLAAQQAELGRRQADAGARQAKLGVSAAELAVEARKRGADEAKLDRQHEELSRRMDQIGREMDSIGGEMDRLGARMEEVGRRMEAAGHRIEERAHVAEEDARRLVDGWIRSGVAKPVE